MTIRVCGIRARVLWLRVLSASLVYIGLVQFLAKQLGHSLSVFETTYAKWIDREEDREKLNEKML